MLTVSFSTFTDLPLENRQIRSFRPDPLRVVRFAGDRIVRHRGLRLEAVETRHDQHDAVHAHPVARKGADEVVLAGLGRRGELDGVGFVALYQARGLDHRRQDLRTKEVGQRRTCASG